MENKLDQSKTHGTGVDKTGTTQHEICELTSGRITSSLRDSVPLKTTIGTAVILHSVKTALGDTRSVDATNCGGRKRWENVS